MAEEGRERIKVRYCIYWENMPFIPSSVPKLPLSMEPSRGKMMKSDNPAPDSVSGGARCGRPPKKPI